jgi:hypothetical protein
MVSAAYARLDQKMGEPPPIAAKEAKLALPFKKLRLDKSFMIIIPKKKGT